MTLDSLTSEPAARD